ncbi:MAG: hypothetical protein ACI8Q1_000259 [Parvicella sp.]|jgi:hypothetical protein
MSTVKEDKNENLELVQVPDRELVLKAIDPDGVIKKYVSENEHLCLVELQDKESYEIVKASHILGKKIVSSLKAKTTALKKDIDAVKAFVVETSEGMLTPLNGTIDRLAIDRAKYEEEKERIKNATKLKIQARKDVLFENDFIFNGSHYTLDGAEGIPEHLIDEAEDDIFDGLVKKNLKENLAYVKNEAAKQAADKAKDDELAELRAKFAKAEADLKASIDEAKAKAEAEAAKKEAEATIVEPSAESKKGEVDISQKDDGGDVVDSKEEPIEKTTSAPDSEPVSDKRVDIYQCAKTLFFVIRSLEKSLSKWTPKNEETSTGVVKAYLNGEDPFRGDMFSGTYAAIIESFK